MSVSRKQRRGHPLRALGIHGLDYIEPVILAALADEQPLLLIGPHGTAKSELLNRIAAELELSHRHYNASLISFDDLLGYPVPNDARTGLVYLRTPGDLWDAESVFLDEISRCRPEHQNKLFSIIHEKRVQGLALERLRYRWAAMNPPPSLEGEDEPDGETYHGSLPLDPALADRFAWVVPVPAFHELSATTRERVIRHGGKSTTDATELPAKIAATRDAIARLDGGTLDWISVWVNALIAPLRDAGLTVSGRRAVMLARNARSLLAAVEVLELKCDAAEALFRALRAGLPQRAEGRVIELAKLTAIHKAALEEAARPSTGTWRRIREEPDRVRRVALALHAPAREVQRIDFGQLVSDAWAGLTVAQRYVFARTLLPALHEDRLPAWVYEQLFAPLGQVVAFAAAPQHQLQLPRSRAQEWDKLLAAITRLEREGDPDAVELGNVLYTLFAVADERFDPDALIAQDRAWRALFAPPATQEAA